MTEVVTYIRCQINGKWTNLGLIAEEDEIQEHFEFVEGLLKEKQRTDQLEKRWEKLKEHFIKGKEQSFGILSWSRNNGMLELIQRLEEDGE